MTNSSPQLLSLDLGSINAFSSGFTSYRGPGSIATIISSIVSVFTIFAGLAFLIYFIIGALAWITSAGDPQKLEIAKGRMSTAVIGLIVVVISFPIVYIIGQLTGFDIINFDALIPQIGPQ